MFKCINWLSVSWSSLSAWLTNLLQMRVIAQTPATIKSMWNPLSLQGKGAARKARLEQYKLFLLQVLESHELPNNPPTNSNLSSNELKKRALHSFLWDKSPFPCLNQVKTYRSPVGPPSANKWKHTSQSKAPSKAQRTIQTSNQRHKDGQNITTSCSTK